jgi:hypothetical protein
VVGYFSESTIKTSLEEQQLQQSIRLVRMGNAGKEKVFRKPITFKLGFTLPQAHF